MSFAELHQHISDLEALLKTGDLAPLMKIGDIEVNLRQAKMCTEEMQHPATNDNVKFLLCRTIETSISNLMDYTSRENHQELIQTLAESSAFKNLQNDRLFLSQQQQQWYPDYLFQEIKDTLSRFETNVNLRVQFENIANDKTSDWQMKIARFQEVIFDFTHSKSLTLFSMGDKSKPLKIALRDKIEAEQLTITRLTTVHPTPSAQTSP